MTANKSASEEAVGGKDSGAKPGWAFDEDGLWASMVARARNDAAVRPRWWRISPISVKRAGQTTNGSLRRSRRADLQGDRA